MLYCVKWTSGPARPGPGRFDRAEGRREGAIPGLQRSGKWRHLWRDRRALRQYQRVRRCKHDELHAILSGLPLFPFMAITVTPIGQHPSAIHQE